MALTPLGYDMTRRQVLAEMEPWQFRLDGMESPGEPTEDQRMRTPHVTTARQRQKKAAPETG